MRSGIHTRPLCPSAGRGGLRAALWTAQLLHVQPGAHQAEPTPDPHVWSCSREERPVPSQPVGSMLERLSLSLTRDRGLAWGPGLFREFSLGPGWVSSTRRHQEGSRIPGGGQGWMVPICKMRGVLRAEPWDLGQALPSAGRGLW